MADVVIKRSGRDSHIISPGTEQGRRWLIANITVTVTFKRNGELNIPIHSDYALDLKESLEKEGLEVDLD